MEGRRCAREVGSVAETSTLSGVGRCTRRAGEADLASLEAGYISVVGSALRQTSSVEGSS